MTDPIFPDLANATPGDPPPVRIGTAWCSTPNGMPRSIPVYKAWPNSVPVKDGVVTDLEKGWTVIRVELDEVVAPEPVNEKSAITLKLEALEPPYLVSDLIELLKELNP